MSRVLFWAVAVAAGIELLYLLGANAFLAFGGVPKMFAGTDSVNGTLGSGWTIIPGRIHLKNIRVTIQDHNVQSVIQLERAFVVLSLHELPSQVFHATQVRGDGLVFRFRHRVMPDSKDLPSVRAVPPIAGFEDPPVFEAWVPEPPIPDDQYHLWTVHLEDVDVHADELWVQQFRYVGGARARGAFRLKAARSLWVGPASLDIEPGRIVVAGRDALRLQGRIECTVHPFDVRKPEGLAVLRYISTNLRLRAEVVDGSFVDVFLDPAARGHVEQRGATLAIDTVLDHGVLSPASTVALGGDSLHVQVGELLADLPAVWRISAAGDAKKGGGRVTVTVSRATLQRRGFRAAPTTISDVTASAASNTLDTTVPWQLRSRELTLGDLVAPDLRILNDVRLGSVRFRGGASVAHGHVAESRGIVSGAGVVELRRAIMDVGETELRGSVWVKATAAQFDERRSSGAFDVSLRGGDLSAADASGNTGCPWGSLDKATVDAHVNLTNRERASGTMNGALDGVIFRWGDFRLSGNADLQGSAEPVDAPGDARSHVAAFVRASRLHLKSGEGAPKRWNSDVPAAIVDAALDWDGDRIDGPVELTAKDVRASIGAVSMKTSVRARVRVKPFDVAEKSGTVSGIVEMTDASLWRGDRRVEGWWAKIGLGPTRVEAKQTLELDGRVSAHFRDGLPGLLALSAAGQIPGFLPSILPLHGLTGTLDVRRRCELTDIKISQMEGGPLVAKGRIENAPGDTRGAVLVGLRALGVVSAGVSLGKEGDGFSLFAGDEWLKKQMVDLDNQAEWVRAVPCDPPPTSACD